MAEILTKIDHHIAELNLSSGEEVKVLFDQLREEFDKELGHKIHPDFLEGLRIRWLGRSERSIRRRVLSNWLKADSSFRQRVGQCFQELLSDEGYVAKKLDHHRSQWEAVPAIAQDPSQYAHRFESAVNYGRGVEITEPVFIPEAVFVPVDLSLPGVERPIGSRHLIRQTFEEI